MIVEKLNKQGNSSFSAVALVTLVALFALPSLEALGGATKGVLVGEVQAAAVQQTPSLVSRAQAGVTSAASKFARALAEVNDVIARTGQATGMQRLIALADEAGEVLTWRRNLGYVDEVYDDSVQLTAIKSSRLAEVHGRLSTRHVDIVTRDDIDELRIFADDSGHYLFGFDQGELPELTPFVRNLTLRSTLLSTLDKVFELQDASAARIAKNVAARTGEAEDVVFERYRVKGNMLSRKFFDGQMQVAPQQTAIEAVTNVGDARLAMNAYYTAFNDDFVDTLTFGTFFSRKKEPFHLAFDHDIVAHEAGHKLFQNLRPEWTRRLIISGMVDNAMPGDYPKRTRHGRDVLHSAMEQAQANEAAAMQRVVSESYSDLHARLFSSHDPTTVRSFIKNAEADLRVQSTNAITEVGERFGREAGMEDGVRSINAAQTYDEGLASMGGGRNPYELSVVINRWEDDGAAMLYETAIRRMTNGEGLEGLSEARKFEVVSSALTETYETLADLRTWALLEPSLDDGMDIKVLVRTMIDGARDGGPLSEANPALADALEESAARRKLLPEDSAPEPTQAPDN